jgi:hypothetical protein
VVDRSGLMVAFASFATNLVAGDTNGQSDVFVTESPALKSARPANSGKAAHPNTKR